MKDKPHTWWLHLKNRGNCLITSGNNLARNKVSDKKKVPETIIFSSLSMKREHSVYFTLVFCSHQSGTWEVFQADCPTVLMDRNMSKISIHTTNDAASKETPWHSPYLNQFDILLFHEKEYYLHYLKVETTSNVLFWQLNSDYSTSTSHYLSNSKYVKNEWWENIFIQIKSNLCLGKVVNIICCVFLWQPRHARHIFVYLSLLILFYV